MTNNDNEQRSRLLSLKLRGLLRVHAPGEADDLEAVAFPLGAALVSPRRVWVLVDGDASSALGPTLAWARRHGTSLSLLVENSAGVLARRAAAFDLDIDVWNVDGDRIVPAAREALPDAASPTGLDRARFVDDMVASGVEPLVEHGVLRGEVRGLEVCRVVTDAGTGEERLEVGIGAHDRETFAMVHAATPIRDSLAMVAAAVLEHRRVDAPHHPYNTLAPERFARWRVLDRPALAGMTSAWAIDPVAPRSNVMDSAPCALRGIGEDGQDALAVFVHGIDLDVVPVAVDLADRERLDSVTVVCRTIDMVESMRVMAESARIAVRFRSLGQELRP